MFFRDIYLMLFQLTFNIVARFHKNVKRFFSCFINILCKCFCSKEKDIYFLKYIHYFQYNRFSYSIFIFDILDNSGIFFKNKYNQYNKKIHLFNESKMYFPKIIK